MAHFSTYDLHLVFAGVLWIYKHYRQCFCLHVYLTVCCVSDSVQKIPRWNFWKFLVNPEGKVVRFWRTDEPMESIRQEVTALVREIILKKRVELWWRSSADTRRVPPLRDVAVSCAGNGEEWTVERHSERGWATSHSRESQNEKIHLS